ncbi:hypothetical protein JAAARDRAFT_34373 [Jaapia argillacea MUCL 33604]|uniref:Uncharacterized protein n=1 Tax=Jaapia argillacea MUCL 33604 TaxID=933084 RepID=A0A067PUQ8_9AGAM|nr:hypothetical protein JAAARDRAFT_34373 [Jaapia argillacea MUCL 33604]
MRPSICGGLCYTRRTPIGSPFLVLHQISSGLRRSIRYLYLSALPDRCPLPFTYSAFSAYPFNPDWLPLSQPMRPVTEHLEIATSLSSHWSF